jgi:hypothetical protein
MSEHLDQPWPGGVPESAASANTPPAPETATPRTDTEIRYLYGSSAVENGDERNHQVTAKLSRTLERDLATALADRDSQQREAIRAMTEVAGLRAAMECQKEADRALDAYHAYFEEQPDSEAPNTVWEKWHTESDRRMKTWKSASKKAKSLRESESLRATGAAWLPIESAPRGVDCFFLIRAKRIGDPGIYGDTSGNPILAKDHGYRVELTQFGRWSSLSIADGWAPKIHPPLPAAPNPQPL